MILEDSDLPTTKSPQPEVSVNDTALIAMETVATVVEDIGVDWRARREEGFTGDWQMNGWKKYGTSLRQPRRRLAARLQ